MMLSFDDVGYCLVCPCLWMEKREWSNDIVHTHRIHWGCARDEMGRNPQLRVQSPEQMTISTVAVGLILYLQIPSNSSTSTAHRNSNITPRTPYIMINLSLQATLSLSILSLLATAQVIAPDPNIPYGYGTFLSPFPSLK